MSDIDWSKAPEGATHWEPQGLAAEGWMRLTDDGWYFWRSVWQACNPSKKRISSMIARPWTGDGLPPVGAVCEVNDQRSESWTKVDSILAHAHTAGRDVAVFQIGDYIAYSPADRFRPIRTPEQIAEEERKAAEKDISNVLESWGLNPIDSRQAARAIHSAGYRKAGDA